MEVDVEELVKLLNLEDSDKLIDNEDYSSYIIQLASCGVEKLAREGLHLRDERTAILNQTLNLVFANYKTFIHTADCTKDVFKEFGSVEGHLETLLSGLPALKSGIEDFLATSRSLSTSRHSTSLTLSKHTQLLEILELPQLMETCVRNGFYDDALDILSYVRRLEKKHPEIPVIQSIVGEVKGVSRLMLAQLVSQLRSPITLPQCLKVVGILRRLDVFSEPELRLKFLQARDTWFTSLIKSIPKEDAYQHITKVVETSRVHLFDIVTQYRAIFSDDEIRYAIGESEINEQSIFQGWILHKVNQFLNILEIDLSRGIGSNIESLLAQCMFFGQSFSRVGADFRNLLIPIFQKAIFTQFEADVRTANLKFDERLSTFSLMDSTQLNNSTFLMDTQQKDKANPPLSLMEFSPLAHYTNGLVSAFNNLRQCCPLAISKKVVTLLTQSISKVVTALVDLHHMESAGFTDSEAKAFKRMVELFSAALLPHINSCLQMLFPLRAAATVTGISVKKLQEEGFGQLKKDKIVAPLSEFLPEEVVTTPENEGPLTEQFTVSSNKASLQPVELEDKTSPMESSPQEHVADDVTTKNLITAAEDTS